MNYWSSSKISNVVQIFAAGLLLLAEMASAQQFSVTNWGHKDGLPSTTIYAVTQTTDGFLWLGTGDGLIRFDGFQFVHPQIPGLHSELLEQVTALLSMKDGGLLVGTPGGLLIRWEGNFVTSVMLSSPIERMKETEDQTLQVETRDKIFLLKKADLSSISSLAKNNTQIAGADRQNSGDTKGLIQQTLHENIPESTIRKILRDANGATWVATENQGLIRISPDESVQHFTQSTGLSSNHIWDIFEDRESNVWAGTQNGLSRLRQDKFVTYTLRDGLLSDIATVLVPADDGGIWIGSKSGLEHFTESEGRHDVLLKGVAVTNLLPLKDGSLLISTHSGIQKLLRRELRPYSDGARLPHIEQMGQSENGDLWMYGQQAGLWHWPSGAKPEQINELALNGEVITSMRGGPRDQVWLGLTNGNVIQRPPAGSHIFTPQDGLPGGTIGFLSPQPDGKLWVASDRGLAYFDGIHFRYWNRSSGLPGERLLWALPDWHGNIWLGYNVGVARVSLDELMHFPTNAKQLHYDFYDDGDGLKSNPEAFGSSPVALTSDGRLWISMSEGIGMIDPAHKHRSTLAPPVHILQLTADGRDLDPTKGIRLPPLTRNVQIAYTGISLSDPRKMRFRYRLTGFEKSWQDAETRRNAFYTNLRPGHYRFQVLAANNDGIWNETGDTLSFEVLPAFYQTPWFLVLCLLAILSLVLTAYRLRLRLAAKELQSRYEERMSERTRIAQDLHDNLIQEMMAIHLQLEIADEVLPDRSTTKDPIHRALDLSSRALTDGRNALHILRQRPFALADIESTLKDTVQSMTGSQQSVQFTTSGRGRLIRPSSGEEILQIVREALRNAIQHTGGARIIVRSEFSDQAFTVVVRDLGPGISREIMERGKPGHFGIRGMKERAAHMGAALTVTSSTSVGTEWKLCVPAAVAFDPEISSAGSSRFTRYKQALRKSFFKKSHS